jgi:hypothetical protein
MGQATNDVETSPWLLLRHLAAPSGISLPFEAWPSIALSILWRIWDARNALIFRDETISTSLIISNIISDLTLSMYRFKDPNLKIVVSLWRDHILACNSDPL